VRRGPVSPGRSPVKATFPGALSRPSRRRIGRSARLEFHRAISSSRAPEDEVGGVRVGQYSPTPAVLFGCWATSVPTPPGPTCS